MSDQIAAMWKMVALDVADDVHRRMNTDEMIGTEDETGYVLMFFNAQNHDGRSTFLSSETDPVQLKKLLKTALRNIDAASVIKPERKKQLRHKRFRPTTDSATAAGKRH